MEGTVAMTPAQAVDITFIGTIAFTLLVRRQHLSVRGARGSLSTP